MPSQNELNIIKRFVIFHHFYRHILTVYLFLSLLYQINLRTYSPSTSCQRLGPCPSRSWWSWSLPAATKIGRRSRARERKEAQIEVIYQPPNYKIKFTLNKIWTGRNGATNWSGDRETIWMTVRRCWSGRSCSSGQRCGDTRNKT